MVKLGEATMRRLILTSVLAICALGGQAQAGVYTDDLAKCLVKETSPDDQKALIFWVFSGMALHPDVKDYAKISETRRQESDKQIAGLLQRLLTADCRTETVASLKYEGSHAIEASFSVLGQVAMRGLMSDPEVGKGMEKVSDYLDKAKFDDVSKAAGLPVVTPAK